MLLSACRAPAWITRHLAEALLGKRTPQIHGSPTGRDIQAEIRAQLKDSILRYFRDRGCATRAKIMRQLNQKPPLSRGRANRFR
jgi:hypothetical protein